MLWILCHILTGFYYRGELAVRYRADVCKYASVRHLHLRAPYFDTGLFDCCRGNVPWHCFMALCCGPVYFGTSSSASGFMSFWLALILSSIFLPVLWIMGSIGRMHIRREFGMGGSAIRDCLSWFCCWPCTLIQENKFMHRTFAALRDNLSNLEILPATNIARHIQPTTV
jgi:Cys-rich protein (TIGR01571 family)